MSWPAVDWSQAPIRAIAWVASVHWSGVAGRWVTPEFDGVLHSFEQTPAPLFGYTGHPRDSLTLRPQKEPTP